MTNNNKKNVMQDTPVAAGKPPAPDKKIEKDIQEMKIITPVIEGKKGCCCD